MKPRSFGLIPSMLLGAALILGTNLASDAQLVTKRNRVAILSPHTPADPGVEAFRRELSKLGYVEGQNLVYEARWAHGRLERMPELASELVRLRPDVILAGGEQALRAAKQATTDTPIVVTACDPLDRFIVKLAAPGGSATGLTCVHSELAGKRLELRKELVPSLGYAAVLYNPGEPNKKLEFGQMEAAGRRLGVSLRPFEVTTPDRIVEAFAAMAAERVQALVVLVDSFMIFHRQTLADLALRERLPTAFGFKEFVEAGGVLSYGASRSWIYGRAAVYVDKILKGAKPGELPIEEPTIFELFINRRTANALGLAIPPTLLARADEVIE